MEIIDSHIHCGVQNVAQPFEDIEQLLNTAGIGGACLFAPVEDIYDRYDRHFDDTAEWRHCRDSAHAYLLDIAAAHPNVFAYHFVWNDFKVGELDKGFVGIKWHHHAGEPDYHYDDPRCALMLDAICERQLPIVLEETFDTTIQFLLRIDGRAPVIIPHLGMLNGGFDRLMAADIWEDANVYADTALASRSEMAAFVNRYGADRLLFGSDYPFGEPGDQLRRLQSVGFSKAQLTLICCNNIRRLLNVDIDKSIQ